MSDIAHARISVVVPTFNRAAFLPECLDALLGQTIPAHEIVVVDDGSDDETAKVVASYGPRVRYLRKDNGGKPSALNLALPTVQGDVVWFFDDDDVALPDAIESRLSAWNATPEAGFVFAPHYYGSGEGGMPLTPTRLQHVPNPDPSRFFFELMKGCFFTLSSVLVRKSLLDQAGVFDEALFSSEDYDMLLRLTAISLPAFSASPAYIVREHRGERGARTIRYSSDRREEIFRAYDRIVGLKLRSAVPLQRFLTLPVQQLGLEERRTALLQRALVMASKGCLDEMFEDLRSAVDTLGSGALFSVAELSLVDESMRIGHAYEAAAAGWERFRRSLRELSACGAGRQLTRTFANGILRLALSYPAGLGARVVRLRRAASLVAVSIG